MSDFTDDCTFRKAVTVVGAANFTGPTSFPDGSITNTKVAASADIAANKLQHRHAISHSQKDGTDVVSETIMLYIARASGTLARFVVRPRLVPTGGDKQYTVDIQKAVTGSNTWTSLLTAVVTVSSSDTNDVVKGGTLIGSPVYVLNDTIRFVITASGSTGSQGQGVAIEATVDESGI